jgi:HSP20 family protein
LKWDPFRDLVTYQEHMNRWFDAAVSEHRHEDGLAGWHPPADVCETEDSIHLFVEIAGMDPEAIDLQVEGNRLSVRGERTRSHRREKSYHMSEILMGPFHRRFILPVNVNPEGIQAKYHQGILEIVLPKVDEPSTRTVPIKIQD